MATKTLKNKESILQNSTDKSISTVRLSDPRRKRNFSDKPSPLDFDAFVPWVCLEWQVPELVSVIRLAQGKFHEKRERSAMSKLERSSKQIKGEELTKEEHTSTSSSAVQEKSVVIIAYYDSHGRLVEVSINSSGNPIPTKIIQAISVCIHFHSFLSKLSVYKGALNHKSIHDISKMLPHSNLTDVCLDDSYVPEGNYYELLDHSSNLKYFSLNRCSINDRVCKEIASRIDYGGKAEKSLAVLNLGSNFITDIGVRYLSDMLRRNRHLLHLNLSGNKIGDNGFICLINHLKQFPLTYKEIKDKRLRSLKYYQRKSEIYEHCLQEIFENRKRQKSEASLKSTPTLKPEKFKKERKKNKSKSNIIPIEEVAPVAPEELAEKMTKEIIGKFDHPYNEDNCMIKNEYCYSVGNFTLCSLNIAYNNIQFLSLLKILEVLHYQSQSQKIEPNTGLIRLVLEGNYFPNSCPELEKIETYLKIAMNSQVQTPRPSSKRRNSLQGTKIGK